MKIKLTFILGKCLKELPVNHPLYFQIYLTEDQQFPCGYMSTKDEYETLKEISDQHFNIDFDWLPKELAGFRRLGQNEVEITYMAHLPEISRIHKSGSFYSEEVLDTMKIELDPYYEKLLSRRGRAF